MPIAAGTPDPVAITTTWDEYHENRILALTEKYKGQHGNDRVNRHKGGVPLAVQRIASVLGVEVLDYRPGSIGRVTILCPHCRGRRSLSATLFHSWETRGAAAKCGHGRMSSCQPHTEGQSDDGESE